MRSFFFIVPRPETTAQKMLSKSWASFIILKPALRNVPLGQIQKQRNIQMRLAFEMLTSGFSLTLVLIQIIIFMRATDTISRLYLTKKQPILNIIHRLAIHYIPSGRPEIGV
jgi:hypothetical protein